NFLLIRSSALVMRKSVSAKRCLLAAAVGAAGSLVILLPELPFIVIALEKIIIGALITFAAFGKQRTVDFAVCALFFLLVSFVYAGLMTALWTFFAPYGMVFGNGVAYFNIPLAAIIAFTAAAYFAVRLVRYFADKRLRCGRICSVKISSNGTEILLRGLCDTGNGLCDIFSGKPVIVCRYEKIAEITPKNARDYLDGILDESVRLIPCRTVTSETLLPIFKTDGITVDGKSADALVGVTKNPLGSDIDCIFDPKIISI
ncbi:MAG: sigma-E processing peptidase SpoIIGA, partial [Ruminococcaceae bacterium]|nr:sigma-E processing peptidase SpoIIGA [Oscillospiraceae bacterium]